MSNLPQSDLILAGRFVDGDLPAHEATQAEARIVKDATFAAAVEQIRNQSFLLGKLPKFKPSDDLADRTLQASLDQVKAIMGAWPIERDDEKVTVAPGASKNSFDWKSTVALAASLAGIFMVGAILWQGNQSSDSNMAMNEAASNGVASRDSEDRAMLKSPSSMLDEVESEAAEPFVAASQMQKQFKSAAKTDQVFEDDAQVMGKGDQVVSKAARQEVASSDSMILGQGKALSGTPMARARAPRQTADKESAGLANASAPVAQIWCVSQDSTASKGSVCDILNLNRIAVKRETQPQTMDNTDAVEAFYVAATPKQMKLALSQISNNANIEMIEIPSANSPIADAIQQQYTQSPLASKANAAPSNNEDLPPNFQRSQAMGQQLFSNFVPRSLPEPFGPVPPILKSGSKIEGLENSSRQSAGLAMTPKATTPSPAANAGGGAGFGGGGVTQMKKQAAPAADANVAMAESAPMPIPIQAQQSAQVMKQLAELDKYLDDSDQLQQFLILVRGGGQENR